eukprot:11162679-Lingulodinium_polyedra.AAC.1
MANLPPGWHPIERAVDRMLVEEVQANFELVPRHLAAQIADGNADGHTALPRLVIHLPVERAPARHATA